jgi:chromate transporter
VYGEGPVHLLLPQLDSLRWLALVIAGIAGVLLLRLTWSVLRTLGVCAVLGLAAGLAGVSLT